MQRQMLIKTDDHTFRMINKACEVAEVNRNDIAITLLRKWANKVINKFNIKDF